MLDGAKIWQSKACSPSLCEFFALKFDVSRQRSFLPPTSSPCQLLLHGHNFTWITEVENRNALNVFDRLEVTFLWKISTLLKTTEDNFFIFCQI